MRRFVLRQDPKHCSSVRGGHAAPRKPLVPFDILLAENSLHVKRSSLSRSRSNMEHKAANTAMHGLFAQPREKGS